MKLRWVRKCDKWGNWSEQKLQYLLPDEYEWRDVELVEMKSWEDEYTAEDYEHYI